jgi:hypothetical protein
VRSGPPGAHVGAVAVGEEQPPAGADGFEVRPTPPSSTRR